MTRVIGRTLRTGVPATLYGYRKWETTLGYPAVLPEAGSSVEGLVYFNLSEADLKRLDLYENVHSTPPAYYRKLTTVQGAHGRISAEVYIGQLNYFRARLKL